MAEEKNPAAVALGKLGGSKGEKACAAKMTPEERSDPIGNPEVRLTRPLLP